MYSKDIMNCNQMCIWMVSGPSSLDMYLQHNHGIKAFLHIQFELLYKTLLYSLLHSLYYIRRYYILWNARLGKFKCKIIKFMASVLTAYSYFKLFRACIYFLRSLLKLSSMDRCNDTKCSVLLQDWCYVIRLYCKWCWSVAHHYWPRFLSDFKKSDNLQNNMLGRWVDGRNDSSTKRLMVEVLFFSWFLAKFFAKILSIYFLIFS